MKLAHLVNPFHSPGRDLEYQQPLVYESIWQAAEFAHTEVDVRNYACFYQEDEGAVPNWMEKLPYLEKSTLGKFKVQRKLPYFKEMLDLLYEYSDADYFIISNADIGFMPYTYLLIKKLIDDGNETFCINKRVVPDSLRKLEDLPVIYSTLGGPHNGMDLWVYPRYLYPKFIIGNICTGVPWSETTLVSSMIAYGKNFTCFRNAHTSWHIGDSRTWLNPKQNDYRLWNVKQFCKCLKQLMKKVGKRFLNHDELQIFGYKLQGEARHYNWMDILEVKYWINRKFGENVNTEILSRLVGYGQVR